MKTIRQFVVLVVLLLVAGRASAQYSESEYNPTVFMVLAEGKNGSPNGVYEMWVDQQVGTSNVIMPSFMPSVLVALCLIARWPDSFKGLCMPITFELS